MMTVEKLVELSGLKTLEEYSTFDYAVPIRRDGTYPFEGRAIAVYFKRRAFPEIWPYSRLAAMAIVRGNDDEELREVVKEVVAE